MKLRLFKSLQFRLLAWVLLGVIPTTIIAIAKPESTRNTLISLEGRQAFHFYSNNPMY